MHWHGITAFQLIRWKQAFLVHDQRHDMTYVTPSPSAASASSVTQYMQLEAICS